MVSVEEHASKLDFRGVLTALIISSFAFVMALSWRDVIRSLIETVVPQGEGLTYQFIAASAITIISVIAIFLVSKYMTIRTEEKVTKK
ncbi:MAG: hypothetical protein DRO99_03165 [Candidatus Aenigmatarchaeota archaeon]|nr:MAG: hypothetical protein DRO99_03165 [Candidatus Aenigmarchaeota archaeon]